ncbi:uncharacterized protein LOC113077691, partial [Carassius auratus]|uniref:Uncharacterized protein LOC113077691 n=1 Tax=Carassius auratus TaxID=7957 RepID=A0A6P6NC46_CARAU
MPYKLWKVRLQCTNPACARQQLCGGGLHRRVRQVLDIDRYYNLVTETLICTRCRTSYLSWSHAVLQQLDLAHRAEFRVILTRKYACDIRVLRLLRERGMGNGPVRIIGQLRENHSEEWLKRALRYTSECVAFFDNRGLHPLHFQEPPPLASVPSYKWLLTITKKLSGPAKGTAQWLTSVGNEIGQVLMSVLTANEGAGLDLMAAGLMERYRSAGVDPPTIIYVDLGCRGSHSAETGQKGATHPTGLAYSVGGRIYVKFYVLHFLKAIFGFLFLFLGNSANSLNFQIYLLEGLLRWNQDRAEAAVADGGSTLRSYTGELVYSVNENYNKLYGRKLVPSFTPPAVYTGELIGVQYLLRQNSQPLEDMCPTSDRTSQLLEEIDVEEQVEKDEGFIDFFGEEATVANLVASDDLVLSGPPVLPAAPVPSVQAPTAAPLPSVKIPPLPIVQTPPLPSVQTPPLPSVQTPPLPSVQTPPLPSVQTPPLPSAPPLFTVRAPSAAPVPSVAASLLSVQAPPLFTVRAPSAAPLPSVQAPPLLRVRAPSAAPVPSVQDPLDTPVPSAMAVDEHCIPGMDRVDALAECLVELRTQTSLTLTNQQVATIVGLWQNLDKFDKDRVVYAARHQDRLLTGRFRSPKKKAVFTPGVDSTKRCVLGSSGSPAQWPNCCRLVEMIFIRLCNIHRSPKKQRTECLSRWDLILRDYRKIRQLILSNGTVMSDTTLQLVEVNQRTLTTWHNNRLKGQEVSLLLQGLDLPEARPVALDVLPPARVQPVVPPQYSHQLHTYQMPPDTAGQAKTKFRKIAPSATCTSATATSIWPSAVHPQRSATSSQLRTICPRPTAPHPLVPDTPTAPVVSQMFLVPCPDPFSTINPGAISSEPPANDTATPTKRSYNRT